MPRKVYCDKCRWYQSAGGFGEEAGVHEACMKIIGYYSTYSAKKITSRTNTNPSELNANNDCAYYSWDWFGMLQY